MIYKSKEEIKEGSVVDVRIKNKLYQGVVWEISKRPSFNCTQIESVTKYFYPLDYLNIIKFISQYYVCSLGEVFGIFTPFLKDISDKFQLENKIDTKIILSTEQKKAYEFIQDKQTSLLFGDTGSGKTEIYLKLFEDVINSGGSCIFLLPEISLTPQMEKRVKEKFEDLVVVWHSKVSKKRKEEILQKIYSGRAKIVMGARSALFLPVRDLKLIVVDEEHDDSYKSQKRPRYNARDLSVYIGQKLGAKVVLGSATPSLTSYKKYPYYRLKKTYFKSQKVYKFIPNQDFISEYIIEQIKDTLKQNKQVIIFLPTRGNFKYLTCKSCGKGIKCPFCDIGMSLHKDKNSLICHYCNYQEIIPNICPNCKENTLSVSRLGTAEVAKVLGEIFGSDRVAKFDKDSVKSITKLNQLLKDFDEKKIDILVGTQMLSKGHDYHDVKLVVVFDIDTILNMADYRSRWRAMSLLLQIGGRVGRKGVGKIVIQSSNKDFFENYLNDFQKFLEDELLYMQDLYPPYKRLLKILIANKDKQKAMDILKDLEYKLNILNLKDKDIEIVGLGEAPIFKLARKYRFQILLRSPFVQKLIQLAHFIKSPDIEIDIDPINFA